MVGGEGIGKDECGGDGVERVWFGDRNEIEGLEMGRECKGGGGYVDEGGSGKMEDEEEYFGRRGVGSYGGEMEEGVG